MKTIHPILLLLGVLSQLCCRQMICFIIMRAWFPIGFTRDNQVENADRNNMANHSCLSWATDCGSWLPPPTAEIHNAPEQNRGPCIEAESNPCEDCKSIRIYGTAGKQLCRPSQTSMTYGSSTETDPCQKICAYKRQIF